MRPKCRKRRTTKETSHRPLHPRPTNLGSQCPISWWTSRWCRLIQMSFILNMGRLNNFQPTSQVYNSKWTIKSPEWIQIKRTSIIYRICRWDSTTCLPTSNKISICKACKEQIQVFSHNLEIWTKLNLEILRIWMCSSCRKLLTIWTSKLVTRLPTWCLTPQLCSATRSTNHWSTTSLNRISILELMQPILAPRRKTNKARIIT